MKIRWTTRGVRVRLDDLEVAALLKGQPLEALLSWAGGGWRVVLDPALSGVQGSGVQGEAQTLTVGLSAELAQLADPNSESVCIHGAVQVDVEKDYLPQHLH